jgi:hypothetical protein
MSSKVVETIWSADKTRRVEIFQRLSGTFGFEEWRYSIDELSWFSFGSYSESFTETSEAAIREARARVSWATDEQDDHK